MSRRDLRPVPALPAEPQKVLLHLTPSEYNVAQLAAAELGMTVPDYFRRVLIVVRIADAVRKVSGRGTVSATALEVGRELADPS